MPPQKNDQIVVGRAKNALLSFFEQRLSVPKIYLDADWQGEKVDVLAIDRAGVGDVSVAIVLETKGTSPYSEFLEPYRSDMRQKLLALPAHFKYLVTITQDSSALEKTRFGQGLLESLSKIPSMFAEDGVGRIGVISVDFRSERPSISVPISAERFRSNQNIYDLAEAFAASHAADFEVRENSS
jgi:hypothetical protein